jgi:NDP-sugar pyrophosphorylase family protein
MNDSRTTTRRAVVLAGGKGMRLRPYTTILPKPLLPIGDRPILEHVICGLGKSGFKHISISVGHLADLIRVFFNDGSRWGVNIDYAIEDEPLGTIGPLALIDARAHDLGDDFLVMNGDLLHDLDYETLWQTHQTAGAALTIATYRREVNIDFGVLGCDEQDFVKQFTEKPTLPYNVSMGIYILNRRCLNYVPPGKPFGFDQLVLALLATGEPIKSHPHAGRWLDLGRAEDYERAAASPELWDK